MTAKLAIAKFIVNNFALSQSLSEGLLDCKTMMNVVNRILWQEATKSKHGVGRDPRRQNTQPKIQRYPH